LVLWELNGSSCCRKRPGPDERPSLVPLLKSLHFFFVLLTDFSRVILCGPPLRFFWTVPQPNLILNLGWARCLECPCSSYFQSGNTKTLTWISGLLLSGGPNIFSLSVSFVSLFLPISHSLLFVKPLAGVRGRPGHKFQRLFFPPPLWCPFPSIFFSVYSF